MGGRWAVAWDAAWRHDQSALLAAHATGVPALMRTTIRPALPLHAPTLLVVALLMTWCTSGSHAQQPPLTFEQHIRPLFRAHCYDCHGATEEIEGGLDLRLVRLMRAGGDSGAAIEPGQPSDSLLLDRVREGEMPPGEKKMTPAEIDTLERWIEAGAPTARPEPESIGPGLGITPEERSFWAFRPIVRPEVPAGAAPGQAVSPVDVLFLSDSRGQAASEDSPPSPGQFGAARLAPEASRRTLIQRAYFDLLGLPPAPEEVDRWVNDADPHWFDQLLTELLDSPHYGERWARHWLDAAGYADSEGYTTSDAPRQWAWKYRDWVVAALNADKPFDQFITEQLAGDELAGPIEGDLKPEQIELLAATGYLRMAADGTGSGANNPEARNQVMADTLQIVGTSLLGLSLQCAQCHDHRYDPIPHTDYFAIRAVFEPALDWQSWKVPAARLVSLYTAADRQQATAIEADAQKIAAEKQEKLSEYMAAALAQELEKFQEPLRSQLRTAYETPADKRTEDDKQLLMKHPSVNITPGNLYQYIPDSKTKLAEFDTRIAEVRAKKPPEAFIRALVEPPGHVPETKLFHRGDFQQPKQTVAPAALTVACPEDARVAFPLDDPSVPTTGRRLAFARWLTDRQNPLFARVIVNRVWMHHFGTGLVNTPGDFGRLGAPPSHPALLDWLADEFIAQGWSLKKLHRTIMTSRLWKQSREPADAAAERLTSLSSDASTASPYGVGPGPFNRLMRLEAESVRDYMLATTGQLDRTLGGAPLPIKEDDTGQTVVDGEQSRRSLYIQVRRTQPVAMLQSFDAPVMATNCEARNSSTVATQSLMLLNGEFILARAAKLADRAAAEPAAVDPAQLATLPPLPDPARPLWQYGYGAYDPEQKRTGSFTALQHWTGSQWQGGATLPDTGLGWVLLNAAGGHPDVAQRAVIRRWTAPASGKVDVSGALSHGAKSGDGVRGRIVSSRTGIAGQWIAQAGSVATAISSLAIQAGDTIDFLTDCRDNTNADSFGWPVKIVLHADGQPTATFSSTEQFAGPPAPVAGESGAEIAGQIVRVWQLAYLRDPSPSELAMAMEFVAGQVQTMQTTPAAVPKDRTALRQAMTNLSQVVLSSNEFLYVE